jgi:hypothetical protein
VAAAVVTLGFPFEPCRASESAPADDPDLLPRVLKKLQGDREESRQWSYVESIVLEKRSTDGEVRSRTNEIQEAFFKNGQLFRRPLSVDLAQDSQGFNVVRREEARFIPTLPQGRERARPDKESPFDAEHLLGCYRFEPGEREMRAGRPTIRLAYQPIEGCLDDGSRAGRLLQNLTGVLWIDALDSDILRIQGSIRSTVTFGFGLLGKVEQLDLEILREPLTPGFYALTHVNYRARGTSFIFHHFDVTSIRDRSAYLRAPRDAPAGEPADRGTARSNTTPGLSPQPHR